MKPRYPSRLPARGTDADTTAQRALDATEGVDRFYPPASESSASSGRSSGCTTPTVLANHFGASAETAVAPAVALKTPVRRPVPAGYTRKSG